MNNSSRFLSLLLAGACLALPGWAQQVVPSPGLFQSAATKLSEAHPVRPAMPAPQAPLSTAATQKKGISGLSACNLVDNPTFNDQLATPNGTLANVPGSTVTQQNALAVWHCTDAGSADHFATNAPVGSNCYPASSPLGSFSPHNNNGPRSFVNGCAGLLGRFEGAGKIGRENITEQLLQPLQSGKAYFVSFWAQLSSESQFATTLTLNVTAADPTAPFGTSQTYTPSQYSLTSPVLDQHAWTQVTGIIYLQPGEAPVRDQQYINIGGMESVYEPAAQPGNSPGAYYYIDDVEIYEIPVAPVPGQAYSCMGTKSGVDIGYGCEDIPGATYSWKATYFDGTPATTGLPPSPTALFNHVYPIQPTTYTLDVLLPGGYVWRSGVTAFPQDWLGIIGRPSDSYTTMPSGSTVCNGRYGRFVILDVQEDVSTGPYIWKVDGQPMPRGWNVTYQGPDYTFTTSQYDYVFVTPRTSSTRTYRVTCEATGSCSGTPVSALYTFTYDPGCRLAAATANMPMPALEQQAIALAYPNPAADQLTLPAGAQQVELRDAMGQPVLQQKAIGQALDVHALPEGIYHLQLVQDGTLQTQRIVIKH